MLFRSRKSFAHAMDALISDRFMACSCRERGVAESGTPLARDAEASAIDDVIQHALVGGEEEREIDDF